MRGIMHNQTQQQRRPSITLANGPVAPPLVLDSHGNVKAANPLDDDRLVGRPRSPSKETTPPHLGNHQNDTILKLLRGVTTTLADIKSDIGQVKDRITKLEDRRQPDNGFAMPSSRTGAGAGAGVGLDSHLQPPVRSISLGTPMDPRNPMMAAVSMLQQLRTISDQEQAGGGGEATWMSAFGGGAGGNMGNTGGEDGDDGGGDDDGGDGGKDGGKDGGEDGDGGADDNGGDASRDDGGDGDEESNRGRIASKIDKRDLAVARAWVEKKHSNLKSKKNPFRKKGSKVGVGDTGGEATGTDSLKGEGQPRLTKQVSVRQRRTAHESLNHHLEAVCNIYNYTHDRPPDTDKIVKSCSIILPDAPWLLMWQVIIMTLTCIYMIKVPIRICFESEIAEWEKIFDSASDAFYLLDIAFNFRIAFLDGLGHVVMDGKAIAWRYLTSWFVMDLCASLPLSWIDAPGLGQANKILRLLKLFKLLRMVRMNRYFKKSRTGYLSSKFNPGVFRFSEALLGLLLAWHYIGCIFWFVASDSLYGGTTMCYMMDNVGNVRCGKGRHSL